VVVGKTKRIDYGRPSPREEARAELARRDLAAFVRQAWHIVEPATPYVHGRHIEVMCEHLMAVTDGEIRNLLITVPPRHMKSTCVAVMWPMWTWIDTPHVRWMFASYALSLSIRDNRKCRQIIDSPWYQRNFGWSFSLQPDQNAKGRFENSRMGYRLAVSTDSAATGEGGDIVVCLSGDTKIQTDQGELAIQAIVDRQLPVNVLSYNHALSLAEYKPIEAYGCNLGGACVQVTCANGTIIRCTATHPIYVHGKGYIQAKDIWVGDTVYESNLSSVRQGVQSSASPSCPQYQGHRMFSQMSWCVATGTKQLSVSRCAGRTSVSGVWKNILSGARRCQTTQSSNMLNSMSVKGISWREASQASAKNPYSMWSVRQRYTNLSKRYWQAQVLFQRVCQYCTSHLYSWRTQWQLCRWWMENTATSIQQGIQTYSQSGAQTRWIPVYDLPQNTGREWKSPGRTSYRLQQGQRCLGQLDITLPIMSQPDTEQGQRTTGLEAVSVVAVTPIEPLSTVYNLRVKDNHNYFANGILTHNCDDPHNAKEAESDVQRQTVLDWWDRTMSTRLNNPKTGARVIVMQRLHQKDLAGHVLEQGDYVHLNLPAEYEEPTSKRYTSIGWRDWRTREGELLWPERVGPTEIEKAKRTLGPVGYAGQYQQRPVPAGGAIFKQEWIRRYRAEGEYIALETPAGDVHYALRDCRRIGTIDLAISQRTTADYTVIATWLITPQNDLLLWEVIRDRMDNPKQQESIKAAHARWRYESIHVEGVAYQLALVQQLLPLGIPVTPFYPVADKVSRASTAAIFYAGGKVYHPKWAAWLEDFEQELLMFPKAAHDDQVDTDSMACALLFDGGDIPFAVTSLNAPASGIPSVPGVRVYQPQEGEMSDDAEQDLQRRQEQVGRILQQLTQLRRV